ncbi:MAG: hypothetical protein AB7S71_07805 [Dongiaceae bacterium]
MVSVVALLCAAMIPRAECTHQTAIDVIRMGDAANELVCMRDSMMTLASLAIRARPDEYWKIVCAAPDGAVLVGERDDETDK